MHATSHSSCVSRAARLRAFTLIELLIVVAIIGILAAIAVPNFLNAQTRAKVARTESDHRAIATAVESYRMDNNAYPARGQLSVNSRLEFYIRLTTPVAYMNAVVRDPMYKVVEGTGAWGNLYPFQYPAQTDGFKTGSTYYDLMPWEKVRRNRWALLGAGVDGNYESSAGRSYVIYNSSNGLNSNGDIMRFGP